MSANQQLLFDFGRFKIPVRVPEYAEVLAMGHAEPLPDPAQAVLQALQEPIGCPPLAQLIGSRVAAKADATAVVVISDDTRPVPYSGEDGILFPLIDEMIRTGLAPANIRLLVATGTHHAMSEESLRAFLDPRIFSLGIPIHNHNCRNQDELVNIGHTELGGDIFINRLYMESDIKILTGLVESHFMAGVSGGRKSICPGLLAERSIHILHAGPILSSPLATDLVLEGNPVHAEALAVALMAGCDMIVNVTLDSAYRTTGVFGGDMEGAHIAAFNKLRTYAGIPVHRKYDLVITHGGFAGINHYQAAKGGLVCVPVLEPGGVCILAGNHPDSDPIGGPKYKAMMRLLGEIGPYEYLEAILDPDWTFIPDQWEAQMWSRLFQITPPENLIYCTLDIAPDDFRWLPGTDARTLVLHAPNLEALIQGSIDTAIQRLSDNLGHCPSIAVLLDGPYGIPLPSR
ncbi:MAG: lactate racemase domain-containing protein [Candidatus Aminicenantaceae bacterium]